MVCPVAVFIHDGRDHVERVEEEMGIKLGAQGLQLDLPELALEFRIPQLQGGGGSFALAVSAV